MSRQPLKKAITDPGRLSGPEKAAVVLLALAVILSPRLGNRLRYRVRRL
jgi:hypothetical protein